MKLLPMLISIAKHIPRLPVKSQSAERYLRKLDRPANAERYTALGLLVATALAAIAGGGYAIVGRPTSLPMMAGAWAVLFFVFLQLPRVEFVRQRQEVERELPFALRNLGALLSMGLSFDRALSRAATGRLGAEWTNIAAEITQGQTLTHALGGWAEHWESAEIKRAVVQVLSVYEDGGGREIRRIGDDMLAIRLHRLREYAGQSAMMGLLFIVASAVLPTFFIVMSSVQETGVFQGGEHEGMAPVLLVIFPLVMIAIVAVAKALRPQAFFAPSKLSYAPLAMAPLLGVGTTYLHGAALYGLLAGVIVLIGIWLYPNYRRQKRLEEIEARLPDALLMMAGLPRGSTIERVWETVARSDNRALATEAEITLRQIRSKLKPETAIEDFRQRNPGEFVGHALGFLQQALETNRLERLSEAAEDGLTIQEIRRQQQGLLAVQKYTLLGGAVLIPIILKNTATVVDTMGRITGNAAGATIEGILPAYMILYALIAAYYLADMEGRGSQALLYFGGMALVGIALLQV